MHYLKSRHMLLTAKIIDSKKALRRQAVSPWPAHIMSSTTTRLSLNEAGYKSRNSLIIRIRGDFDTLLLSNKTFKNVNLSKTFINDANHHRVHPGFLIEEPVIPAALLIPAVAASF